MAFRLIQNDVRFALMEKTQNASNIREHEAQKVFFSELRQWGPKNIIDIEVSLIHLAFNALEEGVPVHAVTDIYPLLRALNSYNRALTLPYTGTAE